jgi:hypothetical protein
MAKKKMGLAIIKDSRTGLVELGTQFFESVEDARNRYPKPQFKILEFPVKFDKDGWFEFDRDDHRDVGER